MSKKQATSSKIIEQTAQELTKMDEMKPPAWAIFAKTGANKERPPQQQGWWHTRAAAILRVIGMRGPIGTQKLRVRYGGKRNRGHKPSHHTKGSGSVIRHILQQLEKAGLVEQKQKKVHKGRVLTGKGAKMLHQANKQGNGKIQTPKQEKATEQVQ